MKSVHFCLPVLALLLVFPLTLGGCSTLSGGKGVLQQQETRPDSDTESSDQQAELIWQRFATLAATAEVMSGPFRISANLRYTDPNGESGRVSALLWGNGSSDTPYPLRLDLTAGVGTVISKIREDSTSLLAYTPSENTAYIQEGARRNLASLGVPVPMTLGELTLLLSGRAGQLFLPAGAQAIALPPYHGLTAESVSFALPSAQLPGILELSSLGIPVSWKEAREKGWVMVMEPSEANPLQPRRLKISHPSGYSAIIVVNDISRVSPPYNAAQMTLVLPPGTKQEALQDEADRVNRPS